MDTKELVKTLVTDYNDYSELVAINIKENDNKSLQWNLGTRYCIERYLKLIVSNNSDTVDLQFNIEERKFNLRNCYYTLECLIVYATWK